jgi:glyoxylase-like metal-dependent hydrolase (beta-lactamase superfamily II)
VIMTALNDVLATTYAPGVLCVPLPLPVHGIGATNCYLLQDDDDGHVLVDPGAYRSDLPDGGIEIIDAALRDVGLRLADVRAVTVTHAHIDHYGLAGAILPRTGGELWMHAAAPLDFYAFRAPERERQRLGRILRMHGVAGEDVEELAGVGIDDWAPYLHSLIEPSLPLWGGETVTVGGHDFEIIYTPGHSRSHICLWSADRLLLLSGDHLLPGISPPINFHHGIDDDPLGQYLDGLARIEALDPVLVLPGHGRPFAAGGRRAGAIRRSKQRRIRAVEAALSHEALTVREIVSKVYDEVTRAFQLRMVMTEVVAIVGFLRKRELVESITVADGITRFIGNRNRRDDVPDHSLGSGMPGAAG